MENTPLDTIRQLLRITSQAQILLEGDRILAASPEAQRLFPGVLSGYTADQFFGIALQEHLKLQQEGSLLFNTSILGSRYDVSVTALFPYHLCTVTPAAAVANSQAMLSTAQQLRNSLSLAIAAAPKTLPRLQELEDPSALVQAAALNQGLFQLLRITENLEHYATSQPSLNLMRFDMREFFQNLEDTLLPLFRDLGRQLEIDYPPEICPCTADPTLLTQAIMNLLSNAIKYSQPDQMITLTCRNQKGRVLISVRDRGQGIPPDQMSAVFFRSEHRGQIPDPRWGAGLGLPAARRIIEAHGGRILLESIEHQGTTVYLSLDAHTTGSSSLHAAAAPMVAPSGINTVLVGLSDVLPARIFHVVDICI